MENKFIGFNYPSTELSKYLRADDVFTIMLKNRTIIHHTIITKEADLFEKWLTSHKVLNIAPEKNLRSSKKFDIRLVG
jgi:hypothetical protein